MACVKLGSKSDVFHQQGQAWFCSTGLPSDVVIVVEEMSYHLHKFPLLSRSGAMEKLIGETSNDRVEGSVIRLPQIPGGAKAFELVAKFCYGMKLEMTASNVVCLRCAAEHLQMTEDYGEGNLLSLTEAFLNHVVFHSWKDSMTALQTCEELLPHADQYNVVKRCIDSLAFKACTDPNPHEWPVTTMDHGTMQSPGGSVLWNGISTGARPIHATSDWNWWYADASSLSLGIYTRLIPVMQSRGIHDEIIVGSLEHYAKKHLPGINRRQSGELGNRPASTAFTLSEEEQKHLLEEIDRLMPMHRGIAPPNFLFGLLRTGIILRVNPSCTASLEEKIGMQLHQATLEDLLIPNFSYSMETLYNVDCVHRVLEHFLAYYDQANAGTGSPCSIDDGHNLVASPSLMTPTTMVAKLIDGYLSEVAPDVNLKPTKFHSLAAAVPDHARPLDDGLYRAIDIFLKAHPWLTDSEREQLCRLMDCQKLSLEACTHAAQNERLPLRVVVQVLFFEQLQLRTSIAGCYLVSGNLEGSRPLIRGGGLPLIPGSGDGAWSSAAMENQVLKAGMDNMRMRVSELEKECRSLKQAIGKLGKGRRTWLISTSKKIVFRMKSHICSAEEDSVTGERRGKVVESLEAKNNG